MTTKSKTSTETSRTKEATDEFEEQSRLFDDILNTMIVGVAKVNMKGIITFANNAALAYLEDRRMVGRYHISGDIDQIDTDGKQIKPEEMPFSRTLNSGETVKSFVHGLTIKKKLKWFSLNSAPLMKEGEQVGAIANFIEITEEIEAQRNLKESEERYRLIAENTGDIIALLNLDGKYIYVSPNIKEVRGYEPGDILKHSPVDYFHPDDVPSYKLAKKGWAKGESTKVTYRIRHSNGQFKWYESTSIVVYDSNKKIKCIQNTARLIHDQKLAEDQLKESEVKFKALAENLPGVVYLVAIENGLPVLYVNEEIKRLTGYSNKDFLDGKRPINSIVHPDDASDRKKEQNELLAKKQRYNLEYRSITKSGKTIWLRDVGTGIYDENGDLKFVEGYLQDITDAKLASEATRVSEQKFRTLFEDSGHAIGITDNKGVFLDANKKFLDLIEYSLDELQAGKTFLDITHPEDLAIGQGQLIKMITTTGLPYQVEKRYVSKSNKAIHFKVNVSYFTDPESGELRIVGTADDITESKLTSEKILSNERKFRSIFENAGHAILITDVGGQVVEMNKFAERLFGYRKKEVEGFLSIQKLRFEEELPKSNLLEKIAKKSITVENRYHSKDGHIFWAQENISSYLDETTKETRIVRIIEDITNRKDSIRRIQASELRFRSVFEEAGHGVVIANENGVAITTNRKFRQIMEMTKKDVHSNISPLDFVHPDYLEETVNQYDHLKQHPSKSIQAEVKYLTKKGKSIWVRLNASTYFDPITNKLRLVGIIEDITRRQVAIEDLKASEEFQHETINALSIGLMVMKTNGEIEQTNLIWNRIIAETKTLNKALLGNNFLSEIKKLSASDQVNKGLSEILLGKNDLLEMELALDKSSNQWFALRASKLKPKFDSIVITLQEVTVRKRVEQALEESLTNYRNIYNLTPVMMHSIDRAGVLISVSDFWVEKLGYERHEIIGKKVVDFLTSESQKDAQIVLPVFFQKGSIFDVSYNFITKSGEIIETLLSAIQEGTGKNARSLAVVTDITPLKKAERQLRKNRKDLEEAELLAKLGHYELDIEKDAFSSSEAFDDLLELNKESQKHFSLLEQITPKEDKDYLAKIFSKVFEKGGPFEYVVRAVTLKSNRTIWLEGLGRVVMRKGKPVKLVGTIQDITKSKTAELEIQKLSERLTLATQSAGIAVWEENLLTEEFIWDDEMSRIFNNLIDISWSIIKARAITHPDDVHILDDVSNRTKNGEELIDFSRRIVLDGQIKHVQIVVRQIFDETGRSIRRVDIARDVTQERLLLQQLENSLEEKDILIKEVHHRVKNNMQMISSILSLKSLELTDTDSKKVFNDCTTRIKSMAMVHDQLYRFNNVSEIDISEYLNHLLSGLHSLMGGSASNFIVNVEADECAMNVDQALLCGLIVSELVANAFKHGFDENHTGAVTVKFQELNGNKSLSVTNTGSNIPKDILEIRTSSLGMSLIKTFVKQLDGTLSLRPDNGLQVNF